MAESTGLASSAVSAGDDATAAQYNNLVTDVKKLRQESINAGETINGATLPVPVYQNTADNEVYACDGNDTTKLNFLGFAITNATDGNAITVQHTGIVGGFTGLAEGTKYYVQDTAGTIGTSKGTYEVLVGVAISETELLIIKKHPTKTIASDSLRFSNDTERTQTSSTYVKAKEILINVQKLETIRVKFNLRNNIGSNTAFCRIYKNGIAIGTEQSQGSASSIVYSEDLTNTFVKGDLIQLYVHQTGVNPVSVKNFRIYYNIEVLPEELSYTSQDP